MGAKKSRFYGYPLRILLRLNPNILVDAFSGHAHFKKNMKEPEKLHILSEEQVSFKDRRHAGVMLGEGLKKLGIKADLVLGIPRGGIVIAEHLADILGADLDILLAHKLGAPFSPELAIGAISEDGQVYLNKEIAVEVGANEKYIEEERAVQWEEIKRRMEKYRQIQPRIPLKGKTVIITDDGVATGATVEIALLSARQEGPHKIIVALPVAPDSALKRLANEADEVVCLAVPPFFSAVGQFYLKFPQVSDEEVLDILKKKKSGKEG
jgi:predicted phosphoribosyltransferase